MKSLIYSLLIIPLFTACQTEPTTEAEAPKPAPTALTDAPTWARDVIWYQIFVERFNNGDPSNDPTIDDIQHCYPYVVPEDWAITPWTQDWYKPDPYFASLEKMTNQFGNTFTDFDQKLQLRRYGGDLQGVLDKLDYLEDLGITAIYFNPLNDAPSNHKYDPRYWHHIDRNFGPNPEADRALFAREDHSDFDSWEWSSADSLFLHLVDELHQRGIRLIMDFSWNHTGMDFWALNDIRQNGTDSKYIDWYWIDAFDNPDTPENEFAYQGWINLPGLPEIKEQERHLNHSVVQAYEGDLASPSVKEHIYAVSRRWLDPNGDGDPSDGVDGFRLDVAGELPLGFWREYRQVVRSINPEAYLIGEIWWEQWPDRLLDPEPFLEGDVFDAVMNYRWYRAARHFFNASPNPIPASEFVDSLNRFRSNLREQNNYVLMNLTASHDVPRVGTSLFNKNKYKVGAKPKDDPSYKIHQPDADTYNTLRLLLMQQYTYVGAPHIWAGDEMGMWGADDPGCRKPLIWPELSFQPETTHPLGLSRPVDSVLFNTTVFNWHKQLIQLRKTHPVLSSGKLEFLTVDENPDFLAYRRYDDSTEVIVAFNIGEQAADAIIPVKYENEFRLYMGAGKIERQSAQELVLSVPPREAVILVPVH